MPAAVSGGRWQPTKPRGPIGAHFHSPGPKYMIPGSTGYHSHDLRKRRGPAYSFGGRHATFFNDASPGPAYLVPSRVTRTGVDGTPKYSLYGRPRDPVLFKNPGPGTYCPEKSGKSAYYSAPSYSLSGRTKAIQSNRSPGPAAYGLKSMMGKQGFSMTGRGNSTLYLDRKTPGPGTYTIVHTNVYKNKSPFYSITGRNQLPTDATQKPGPGAHSPEKVVFNRRSAPAYSFGMRHSEYIAPLILDPEP